MQLTKGQRNELFRLLEENDFNVKDFSLDDIKYESEPEKTVGWKLSYIPRPEFYFVAIQEPHGHEIVLYQICPGEVEWEHSHNQAQSNITPSFNEYQIQTWLERIKKESEDDLWESLANGTHPGEQKPDSAELVQEVVGRLIAHLPETNLTIEQQSYFAYHFNLTVNYYQQNPKFDWKGYIIGVITSAAVNMLIDTNTGKYLFTAATKIIKSFLLLN